MQRGHEQNRVEHSLKLTAESLRQRPRHPKNLGGHHGWGNSGVCTLPLSSWVAILPRAGRMHHGISQADSESIPLHNAVLCINCECVSNGLSDECLVCGSRSLFSLARLLGGTELSRKAYPAEKVVLFDAEITISFRQIQPKDLSATVEGIASLIDPNLGRCRACFHINVEPVSHRGNAEIAKAA
jgi:hypothetical protein